MDPEFDFAAMDFDAGMDFGTDPMGGLAGLGGFDTNAAPPDAMPTQQFGGDIMTRLTGADSNANAQTPLENLPRGIRNNNPGNVEFRSKDPWEGQVSREQLPSGGQGRFAVFETPEHGIRAMTKVLMSYQDRHGLDTLEKIVNRYAPPSENNTSGYAKFLGETVGLNPSEPFRFVDDPNRAQSIIKTMIRKENGIVPYSDDQISRGIGMAWPIKPIISASQ